MHTNIVIDSKGFATITIGTSVSSDNFKKLVGFISGLSMPEMPAFKCEVLELLRNGQKLAAVKLWKENTSMGLKESKDAVEVFAAKELPNLYDEQGRIRN
jgi:hypothetical protein